MSMRPLVETPARVPNADLIFVLAGLEARKAFGLRLLNRQLAPRILLSVGRFEIRKLPRLSLPAPINLLEIAATIPPVLRHYFVWFEGGEALAERIPVGRFGTWMEIESLARWLQKRKDVHTVLVVSSAHHLPRIRICCRALLAPRVNVLLVPLPQEEAPEESRGRKEMLAEWLKIPVYCILSRIHRMKRGARGRPLA